MGKHAFLVFSNPTDGKEDVYNQWYDTTHLAEVLAIDGSTGATRYRVSDAQMGGAAPTRYLTIYEIEGDDPGDALKRLRDSMPTLTMTDAIDRTSVLTYVYTATGERVAARK